MEGWKIGVVVVLVIIVIVIIFFWGGDMISSANWETFKVTVARKDDSHAYFGRGSDFGYVIDGVQGKVLNLRLGQKYRFDVEAPDHPFYIAEDPRGAGKSGGRCVESIDVPGTPVESGSITFTPAETGTLFYACCSHPFMGSRINVVA